MSKENQGDMFGGSEKSTVKWFDDWFNEFWHTYPSDSSKQGAKYTGLLWNAKGNPILAKERAKKIITTQEKATEVIMALREQIRYARAERAAGVKKPYTFIQAQVWIKQKDWGFEIPSYTSLKETVNSETLPQCIVSGCSNTVFGNKFKHCADHCGDAGKISHAVRKTLEKNNLLRRKDETKEQWRDRLRGFVKQKFQIIGNR